MSRRRSRVAVLYNAPTLARDHPDFASESGVVDVARAVAIALKRQGFRPFLQAARLPVQRLVRSLVKKRPDVVFNLIEGFGGDSAGEAWITSLLELLHLPYTGCPPVCQSFLRSKLQTKRLLLGAGLPTASFWIASPGKIPEIDPGSGPWIVKPESQDASLGISQESIVMSRETLAAQVERVCATYGPRAIVEAYLPGPEFNIGVLAMPSPEALPVAEILYRSTEGRWPILTHAAKWDVGSVEDEESRPRCPAEIDANRARHLQDLAVRAFEVCGCRDYARVDFRLDAQGRPMILEVNPNPDLDPEAGLSRAIAASGRDWSATIAAITVQARERGDRDD